MDNCLVSCRLQISDSLTTFGISDNDSSVLAVLIDSSDISSNLQKLTEVVKGEPSPIEDLGVIAEPATVKKVRKRLKIVIAIQMLFLK